MKTNYKLICCVLPWLLAGCKSAENPETSGRAKGENIRQTVIQPLKNLEIKPLVYQVSADKPSEIVLPNGGKISFPEQAFCDEQGQPVHGQVKVSWQEFHDLADVVRSGIPMVYDSAGVQNHFVSGGMFTIQASQKGKAVQLAKGKNAEVELVSINAESDYSFYQLDEKKGDWKYRQTAAGIPIAANSQKNDTGKPPKTNAGPQLFDVEVNTSAFPELKNEAIVAWQAVDKVKMRRKSKSFKSMDAELLPDDEAGCYQLKLSQNKNSWIHRVRPYTLADARRDSKAIEAEMKAEKEIEKQFQAEVESGKYKRVAEIDQMGTYNWDRIYKFPDHKLILTELDFPCRFNVKKMDVYFVAPSENLVIRIDTQKEFPIVRFSPQLKFTLVGIAPDQSSYQLSGEGMKELQQSAENVVPQLRFDQLNLKVDSGDKLRQLLYKSI